jgi:hypothetical protein
MDEIKAPPEGIYLETKKNIIGTGSTSKVAEYRNFWATLRIAGGVMEMVLLDDSFALTGIREKFPVEVVGGSNWLYVEQGQKRYLQLKPKLESLLAPPAPKAPAAKGPGGGKAAAAKGPVGGKPAAAGRKTGWWSK